jgi:hypothetical protein
MKTPSEMHEQRLIKIRTYKKNSTKINPATILVL